MTDISAVSNDAAKASQDTSGPGGGSPSQSNDHADKAQPAREALEGAGIDPQTLDDVKSKVTDASKNLLEEIQAEPLRALATAAAIGFFVGWVAAR